MELSELIGLIEKCRTGDPEAQEKLVVETQNKVYYHCMKFLKNEQDAQDATQDVLITMLTKLDRLKEPAAFWGWLNTITANRCKELLTRGVREWQIPEDEEGNSMLDDMETLDDQAVPDKVMDNAETQRLILDIIDDLPAEQRMTVTFFYYDEMSVKDIAAAMEVSEGTVKSRLNYARKSIKEGVEKLAKQGTKLYGISPLPFLAYFLRMGAESQALSPAAAAAITQGAMTAAGTTAAGVAGAGTAAGTAATTATTAAGAGTTAGTTATAAAAGAKAAGVVSTKLIAGVLAGTIAAGGVGTVAYVATHQAPDPTPTPVQTVVVTTPTPEPTPSADPYTLIFSASVSDESFLYWDGEDLCCDLGIANPENGDKEVYNIVFLYYNIIGDIKHYDEEHKSEMPTIAALDGPIPLEGVVLRPGEHVVHTFRFPPEHILDKELAEQFVANPERREINTKGMWKVTKELREVSEPTPTPTPEPTPTPTPEPTPTPTPEPTPTPTPEPTPTPTPERVLLPGARPGDYG